MNKTYPREMTLKQALHRRVRQQATVANLSKEAQTGRDLKIMLDTATAWIANALSAEYCLILEHKPRENTLILRSGFDFNGEIDSPTLKMNAHSLSSECLKNNQGVLIRDFSSSSQPSRPDLPFLAQMQSAIAVEIRSNSQTYGVVEAYGSQPHAFELADLDFLHSIAYIISTAIELNHHEQELSRARESFEMQLSEKLRRNQLLHEITLAASEASSIEQMLQVILQKICAYAGWSVGHVYLSDKKEEDAALLSSKWWFLRDQDQFETFRKATEETVFNPGQGLPGKAYQTMEPVWERDLSSDKVIRAAASRECGLKSGIAFPIVFQDNVVAVLEFFSEERKRLDANWLDLLENIGGQIGYMIERQRAQEALETSQQQLSEAQRIARLGSWEWDIRNNRVTWSDMMHEIYGVKPGEFKASYEGFLERVHPEDRERVKKIVQEAYERLTPFDYEHRIVLPGGEIRTLYGRGEVIADENGKAIKMFGTGQDITHAKKMEEGLQAREELLRMVVSGAPIILWAIDRDGKFTLVEGRGLSATGISPGSFVGTSIYDLIQNFPDIQNHIQEAMNGKEVIAQVEGKNGIFEMRYGPIYDNQSKVAGIIGVSLDITDRVRAEAAWRESEARFRTIFEGTPNGIFMIDLQNKFLLTNPAFQKILSYMSSELEGREFWEIVHPYDRAKIRETLDALFAGQRNILRQEIRFNHKEGEWIWVNLSLALVKKTDGNPKFAVGMAEDITTHKRMQAELAEIQKQLVASREKERLHLAQELHDDPIQDLYGILYHLGSIQHSLDIEESDEEFKEMETSITQVIDTLRSICGELRPPTLAPFGLESAIREHAESFQRDYPDLQVHLDLMYDAQMLPEHLRLTLFRTYQQAVVNTARHAEASNLNVRFRFDQEQAVLEIEDDGKGFDVPSRWVEFVRQDHLGLAGTAERIELVNGQFQVISIPGKGTHIIAKIPLKQAGEN